jgi:membrane peptidoglycan carboxypeptidase
LGDIQTAKSRQKYVLDRMRDVGFIDEEEVEKIYSEELIFADQAVYIRAPHFVNYVRKDLEKRYGKRFVEFGGLTVTTTLDLNLYEKVQSIIFEEVGKNSYLGFSNGASVVMDAKSSEVLAYVGSVDYFREDWGAYDVVTALRQPGSSIKPITYALALSGNYTPATIINDSPVKYQFNGSEPYIPVNYDNRYHGRVTLRQALANSYNVPAVKVARVVGPDNIALKGKEMGLTNWESDGSYGLSITLGGKEVKLLDHTNLYAH